MIIRALKTYRVGEPKGGTTDPPAKIAALMVKLLSGGPPPPGVRPRPPRPRIIKGATYRTFPVELGKALVAAGAAEELDNSGSVVKKARPAKKEKK